jgi:hypothetical protein
LVFGKENIKTKLGLFFHRPVPFFLLLAHHPKTFRTHKLVGISSNSSGALTKGMIGEFKKQSLGKTLKD